MCIEPHIRGFCMDGLPVQAILLGRTLQGSPTPALFNPLSAVALIFIVGKLFEQPAGEFSALTAVFVLFLLAAGLHRAAPPKGILNLTAS